MSGIHRFLTKKEKHGSQQRLSGLFKESFYGRRSFDAPLHGLFGSDERTEKLTAGDEQKIAILSSRLSKNGILTFKENDVIFTLATEYARGDPDRAYELLLILDESEEGVLRRCKPTISMLGAVNREGITCYLDSLLFAMYATMEGFEAMLNVLVEDEKKRKLAVLLRLWVNLLRSGKLITVDITKQLQRQLAECGWKEAVESHQQDASEAFSFITEVLALPLLALKMDIFHTGKEDETDDHKIVNERLLELAIPENNKDGSDITLEQCLEMYFNNRVEVKRYLDMLTRRNTAVADSSRRGSFSSSMTKVAHIEEVQLSDERSSTSRPSSSSRMTLPIHRRSSRTRERARSIIQEVYPDEKRMYREDGSLQPRVKKEVVMPAWQFFSLIPWYTENSPKTDAQVAAHFSSTKPVLGICLKRYYVNKDGKMEKNNSYIDIPLDIALPHFISDDGLPSQGASLENHKLSLQSVVCHQGNSVDSGHYIALSRQHDVKKEGNDHWLRFDDLAQNRVEHVDIKSELKQQSPYLLFYQVLPIEGDLNGSRSANGDATSPPSYADSTGSYISKVDSGIGNPPGVGRSSNESTISPSISATSNPLISDSTPKPTTHQKPSRTSLEYDQSSNLASRISRVVSQDNSNTTHSSRNTSREPSRSSETRLSRPLSRIANRLSKEYNRHSSSLDTQKPSPIPLSIPAPKTSMELSHSHSQRISVDVPASVRTTSLEENSPQKGEEASHLVQVSDQYSKEEQDRQREAMRRENMVSHSRDAKKNDTLKMTTEETASTKTTPTKKTPHETKVLSKKTQKEDKATSKTSKATEKKKKEQKQKTKLVKYARGAMDDDDDLTMDDDESGSSGARIRRQDMLRPERECLIM